MDLDLPRIAMLHARHPGLTRALSEAYEQATAVSLAHHHSPALFRIWTHDGISMRNLVWPDSDERQKRAWANEIDRTEAAAYGVSLSVIEAELGMVAVERARTMSGADYYVALPSAEDLEDALRLEISGTTSSSNARLKDRVKRKTEQVHRNDDPALVCVVGFGDCRVVLKRA